MRRWTVLLLGILLFPLGGCEAPGFLPYARELEDMALMRTLGVDAAGGNGVVVTVSTGEQAGGEEPVVLSGTAGTISGACLDMQSQGSSYIYPESDSLRLLLSVSARAPVPAFLFVSLIPQ